MSKLRENSVAQLVLSLIENGLTERAKGKGKGKGKGNKVCKTDTGHRPVTPVESAAFAI